MFCSREAFWVHLVFGEELFRCVFIKVVACDDDYLVDVLALSSCSLYTQALSSKHLEWEDWEKGDLGIDSRVLEWRNCQ